MLPRRHIPILGFNMGSRSVEREQFKLQIPSFSAFDIFSDGRSAMRYAKHIFKERMLYEVNQHQQFERFRNNTVKKIAESRSVSLEMKAFGEVYKSELQTTKELHETLISKLSAADGPYEMVKRWLDAPTTKSVPESLGKQYKELLANHEQKVKLLQKERQVIEDTASQLRICQSTLCRSEENIQKNTVTEPSSRQVKELRHIQSQHQELQARLAKSLKTYRALLTEEAEYQDHFKEEMKRIAKEIKTYELTRVDIANKAFSKFASILNHQENSRQERVIACRELVNTVSPFVSSPKISSDSWQTDHSFTYTSDVFTDDLQTKEMSCLLDRKGSENTQTSLNSRKLSAKSAAKSLESLKKNSSTLLAAGNRSEEETLVTPFTLSTDTEDDQDKVSKVNKELNRARRARRRKNINEVDTDSSDEITPPAQPKLSWTAQVDQTLAEGGKHLDKPRKKLTRPQSADPSSVKPKRKLPPPPNEDVKSHHPRYQTRAGCTSKEETNPQTDEMKLKRKSRETQLSDSDVENDVVQPDGSDMLALKVPVTLRALVSHVALEVNQLNYKKGQKVTQTHEANREGIAYGYVRKHGYSRTKYGYFSMSKMEEWNPSAIDIIKEMF